MLPVATRAHASYTEGMKVAVSIPDPTFAEAEELSRLLGTSRSKLYARALDAFLAAHRADRLAKSWNDVIDEVGAEPDPVILRAASRQVLRHTEW